MKLTSLINLRILLVCVTLLSAHACGMAYQWDYPKLARVLFLLFGTFVLITLTFLLIRPARRRG